MLRPQRGGLQPTVALKSRLLTAFTCVERKLILLERGSHAIYPAMSENGLLLPDFLGLSASLPQQTTQAPQLKKAAL